MGFQTGRDSILRHPGPRSNHRASPEHALVHKETAQPVRMRSNPPSASPLSREDPRKPRGSGRDRPPLFDAQVQDFQLPASNAGQHITHAVVVAELGVFVGAQGIWIVGLCRPESRLLNPAGIPRRQHPPTGRGDDFVAVKRERRHIAERPRSPVLICRAQRFGGVFEHGHSILDL